MKVRYEIDNLSLESFQVKTSIYEVLVTTKQYILESFTPFDMIKTFYFFYLFLNFSKMLDINKWCHSFQPSLQQWPLQQYGSA
jgi:hypothetical protein